MPLATPQRASRIAKPLVSVPLQRGHPLAAGLLAFYPFNDGARPAFAEKVNGLDTLLSMASALISGNGLLCTSTGQGARIVLPARLKIALPFTYAVRVRAIAGTSAYGDLFGGNPTEPNSAPFSTGMLFLDHGGGGSSQLLNWAINSAGSYVDAISAIEWATLLGRTITLCGVATPAGLFLYLNGDLISSNVTALSNQTYAATNVLVAGSGTSGSGNNSGASIEWGGIWNRALTGSEIRALHAAPYQLFAPPAWQSWPVETPPAPPPPVDPQMWLTRPIWQPVGR